MTASSDIPTPNPLRVAVFGAGHIARLVHIPVLAANPGVQVAAIADPHAGNLLAGLQQARGAQGFADYREALAAGGLDAAVLTLPSPLHAEATIAALQAGLHVYIEKPLALSLSDAERIAAAWRTSGKVGWVGFNFRHNPLFEEIRTALELDVPGRLASVRTIFSNQRPVSGTWRADPASGNTALLEFGPHHIDMLLHLLGSQIVEVEARSGIDSDDADFTTLLLRFENGLTVQCTFTFGAPLQDTYEFIGDKGILRLHRHELAIQFSSARARRGKVGRVLSGLSGAMQGLATGLRSKAEPSYPLALRAFVDAASRGDFTAHPNIEDGLAVQRVLDAAAQSIARRSPVSVSVGPPTPETSSPVILHRANANSSPRLTAIMDKRAPMSQLIPSLRALSRQTVAQQIELLFFTDEGDSLEGLDSQMSSAFERVTYMHHRGDPGSSIHEAVRAASAPIVLMYEDHVFPSPDWAESLLNEFDKDIVAACTRIYNANPGSFWSEACFAVPFGFFTDPEKYFPAEDVIVINGAYRRAALLNLGRRLPGLMKRGGGLNAALREAGGVFAIARTGSFGHANPSLPRHALGMMFDIGRRFAGRKRQASRMGPLMRWANIAATPLIPFQRFADRYPIMFSGGRNAPRRVTVTLALFVGFCAEALGRMVGYLYGEGQAVRRVEAIDFNRVAYLRQADLALFDPDDEIQSHIRSLPPVPRPLAEMDAEPAEILTRRESGSTSVLSLIVIKRTPFSILVPSLRALARQTIADRLELILFTQPDDRLEDLDHTLISQFERCTIVRHLHPSSASLHAAIRQANSPLVCQYEDHVLPEADWAETLVNELQRGATAACTRIVNANPASFWSAVALAVPYGFWIDPLHYDHVDDVMFHNGVYQREALLAFGERLPALLARGGGLNRALVAAGGRLVIARGSAIRHANPSRFTSVVNLLFNVGRLFADRRRRTTRMSLLKRMMYIAAGPLVPFQRFMERYPVMFSNGRNAARRTRTMAALFFGFSIEAFGRMVGYLFGPGSAHSRMDRFEFNRAEFLNKADRKLFDLESRAG